MKKRQPAKKHRLTKADRRFWNEMLDLSLLYHYSKYREQLLDRGLLPLEPNIGVRRTKPKPFLAPVLGAIQRKRSTRHAIHAKCAK